MMPMPAASAADSSSSPGALRQAPLPLIIPPDPESPSESDLPIAIAALAADGAGLPSPLHPAEEVRLTWDLFLGRQAQARLAAAPRIPPAARVRLQRIAAWGRAAQARLVAHNLRLVVHRAQRSWERRRRMGCADGLARDDLIQAGAIGLMTAVTRFDPRHGVRFSTYAVPWIDQAIQRAGSGACSIPLPAYLAEEWRHVAAALDESGGDMARAAALAAQRIAARGTPSARKRAASLTPATLRAAAAAAATPASLDAPASADPDASPLGDLIAASAESPADLAERRIIAAQVRRLVAALPEAERAAVLLRFFSGEQPPSQEERAAALGVSVRRLRTLEHAAIARLRAAAAALDLHETLAA